MSPDTALLILVVLYAIDIGLRAVRIFRSWHSH
jgi:hypothetical protein